ncbi:hypothetical protein O181_117774, partial [Austropuccinia psidii MF-1]|nr:hypothetical protein [Austropuccinia psidii MF-1]
EGSRKSSGSSHLCPPSPISPASSAFSDDSTLMSPKVSWFANIFPWKTTSFRLMSRKSCTESRAQAKLFLEELGCLALVEKLETTVVLRCKYDDHLGETARPIKFKAEFIRQNFLSPNAATSTANQSEIICNQLNYQSYMVLTLEKGSVPKFKELCNRFKTIWELDETDSEAVGLGVQMN